MGKSSLRHQVKRALQVLFAPGESRDTSKTQGQAGDRIFSFATITTYLEDGVRMVQWCQETYGVRELSEITPAMVIEYVAHLIDAEVSGGYLGRVKAAIRKLDRGTRALSWQKRTAPEWLPAGGGWHSDARPERAYTLEQAEQLIAALAGAGDPQIALVVRLQCVAGLRVGEAAMVRGQDIDVAAGIVQVRRGSKGGRPRDVTIDPQHREFLQRLQQRAAGHRDGCVFQGRGDRGASLIQRTQTAVATACQTLGILCYGTHGFRKTYAQARYAEEFAAGATDRTAREQLTQELGHNRIAVTYSYVPRQE